MNEYLYARIYRLESRAPKELNISSLKIDADNSIYIDIEMRSCTVFDKNSGRGSLFDTRN